MAWMPRPKNQSPASQAIGCGLILIIALVYLIAASDRTPGPRVTYPPQHAVQAHPDLIEPEWPGTVTRVIDGDSFEVERGRETIMVRLIGVDCPEKDQPFADEARAFTSELLLGQKVFVQAVDIDRYDRTVADVYTSDGTHLNATLVENGLAWWYKRYAPDATTLRDLETSARDAKRGLWSRIDPTPPWEYREQNRR